MREEKLFASSRSSDIVQSRAIAGAFAIQLGFFKGRQLGLGRKDAVVNDYLTG
ncbi:MAG: hypothetical protein WAN43_15585 [Rhodomicrobium sp.]